MRLNVLGAPDEETIVPSNKIEGVPPPTEKLKKMEIEKLKRDTAFIVTNIAILNATECREMK